MPWTTERFKRVDRFTIATGPPELRASIAEQAELEERSVSQIYRRAVTAYIAAQREQSKPAA